MQTSSQMKHKYSLTSARVFFAEVEVFFVGNSSLLLRIGYNCLTFSLFFLFYLLSIFIVLQMNPFLFMELLSHEIEDV